MKTKDSIPYRFFRLVFTLLLLAVATERSIGQETAFSQFEGWVRTAATDREERSRSLAIDAEGNTIITGYFEGSIQFSSPSKTITLSSQGLEDIFISKYDVCGNIVWAFSIGAEEDDQGRSVTTDALGNIYVTGFYESKVDFNPGPGIAEKTSVQFTTDVFFAKYDKNGNFLWVKSIGGPDLSDNANAISLDANGNIYLTGTFKRDMNFNPDGTSILTSTRNQSLSRFSSDIFFAKYSPNGNFIWAKSIGGEFDESGNDIKVNDAGEVYVTGYYAVVADFNPDPLQQLEKTSAGTEDIFLAKYTSSGSLIWVNSMGSNSLLSERGHTLVISKTGEIIIGGQFAGTVDFDTGPGVKSLASKGGSDIFLASYSSTGQLFWCHSIGSTINDACLSIALDASNNIYATGYFSEVVDFNPASDQITNISSNGFQDVFF